MGGRPTYDRKALEPELLEWISEGKTLRDWCRLDHTPSFWTVYKWKDEDQEFATRFARARDVGFDAIAEDTRRIAREEQLTERVEESDRGRKVTTEDNVASRRLQVHTNLQLLARWSNRYSDRMRVGGDAEGTPLQLSDEERNVRLQALLLEALENKEKGIKPDDDDE